ncbi:MAG TPA: FtsW/RodA/SpoVE family cell cycle protein, partial [Treponemataceae bacterium]|nr:FtsW/RodA/SpoVE family cell cycle protein [Treponemataceae bacterium]
TQSHYRFLPQQSTDFIFSILSEELGFAGGLLVFFLYFVIIFRTFFIMKGANNSFGYYIATGIMGMLFFHFVVNIGMVMGIMPITGIPLLFLSYGGSSLWNVMFCMGLLMSINFRRLDFN